jgi:hypothetical protein
MKFTSAQIAKANASSRSRGAVGLKALVPRYVTQIATPAHTILDFGAGKDALHTRRLTGLGLNVEAYDFGNNVTPLHNERALQGKYDIVFASNVLNVQQDETMLRETLRQIWQVANWRAVFNYPVSPRYSTLTVDEVEGVITEVFGNRPERVAGTKQAPVWVAKCSE